MNKIKIMAFFTVLLCGSISIAGEGVGSHGGDAVVTPNALRLRDLMDPGNCTYRSGKTILSAYPSIDPILKKIQETNPYLGYGLEQQIRKIRWCLTTTLKQINTNDNEVDKLTYFIDPYATTKIQVGARVLDVVYVDQLILQKMAGTDQPYFFIHEALHGYIDPNATLRNKKIRDTVNAIKGLVDGTSNLDDFDAALLGSEIKTILSADKIQNIARALYDVSLTKQEQVRLSKTFPYQDLYRSLESQVDLLRSVFSTADFQQLLQVTGLAKFEFLQRDPSTYPAARFPTFGNCTSYISTYYYYSRRFKNESTGRDNIIIADDGFGWGKNMTSTVAALFFTDECDIKD